MRSIHIPGRNMARGGEMDQQFRTAAALPEDSGLVCNSNLTVLSRAPGVHVIPRHNMFRQNTHVQQINK